MGLNNENDLYYEIGIGKYSPTSVIKLITGDKEEDNSLIEKTLKYSQKSIDADGDIIINGMNDIKVTFGGCCKPIKGDDIVGYISTGKGITIHRKTCHNICDVETRIISVDWNDNSNKKYITNVIIYTEKKDNVLLDIIAKTTSSNIGVKSVNTVSALDYNAYDISILVSNIEELNKYMNMISQLSYVTSVERGNK